MQLKLINLNYLLISFRKIHPLIIKAIILNSILIIQKNIEKFSLKDFINPQINYHFLDSSKIITEIKLLQIESARQRICP
jgi:hypothetical protein